MPTTYDHNRPEGHILVAALHDAKPRHDVVLLGTGPGIVRADSNAEYVGRGPKCAGNDETCNANKVAGHDYCIGHLRQMGAAK
jgi:hypothetical protein